MEARNDLGVGEPSPRIVFRTANSPRLDREIPKDSYNVTSCCVNAGVMEDCEQAYHQFIMFKTASHAIYSLYVLKGEKIYKNL